MPSVPAFSAPERSEYAQSHQRVFRYIQGVRGAATAKRYTALILDAAKRHHLDPLLVATLIQHESSFNPGATSRVGAIGLMQVMPFHFTRRRIPVSKWRDAATNLDLGCRIFATYLAMMTKRYPGLSATALHHRALVAYNMGPRAVVSRGIYRSRYSQKIVHEEIAVALARKPKRTGAAAPKRLPAPKATVAPALPTPDGPFATPEDPAWMGFPVPASGLTMWLGASEEVGLPGEFGTP